MLNEVLTGKEKTVIPDFKHVTPEYIANNKLADRIIGIGCFIGLVVLVATDVIERFAG